MKLNINSKKKHIIINNIIRQIGGFFFTLMPEKIRSPREKGKILCEKFSSIFRRHEFPKLRIEYPSIENGSITLRDENDTPNQWDKFVQFPQELSSLFPGSYVSPQLFLETLGGTEESKEIIQNIVSTRLGGSENHIFDFDKENFHLHIMNGMTNKHALTMSRLAKEVSDTDKYGTEGFASEKAASIRAEYQTAMQQNIIKELESVQMGKHAVRIHDDCLASGDSIISYLYDRIQYDDELKKLQDRGISIVIDGAATAQGILYLQAFANAYNIPLDLTAGHMAFGLTAGVKESVDAPLKHANYITYPPQEESEFYDILGQEERQIIKDFGEMGAVVGDMGEAEKGINEESMKILRKTFGEDYCKWNDIRTDNHGDHPNSKEGIILQQKTGESVTDYVYFARGGYVPYAFDLMSYFSSHSQDEINVIIMRLSRLNVTGGERGALGYGAAFTKADCVKDKKEEEVD